MRRRNNDFQTIRSEGGLLPPDLLKKVIDPKEKLPGTRPEDYELPVGERLNEVITQSWNRLGKHWTDFRSAAENLPEGEPGIRLTNEKWNLPIMRELGFGLLPTSAGPEAGGRTYPINRLFGPVPIHLIGCGLPLDHRTAGARGAASSNPHGLVQDFLNRSPGYLWGIVSNGRLFRILRNSQALSRQSFLEFDLETMFQGELYSDFVLFWLMAHATRFAPREGERPESCWLEQWIKIAEEQGTRALGDLKIGVEKALKILGEGFTSHPKNMALRDGLRSGQLKLSDFHGQLLRVVYRLIFLFVAEDRKIEGLPLLHPLDNSDAAKVARDRYAVHYSTARLRDLAAHIKGSRHVDLWFQFQLLVGALSGKDHFSSVRENLALPVLGSFLWDPASTAALNDAELTNFDFLEAIRNLAFTRQGRALRPVDYRNLGAEELGGVYESLLALTPQISADGARFTFAEFAGSERKTSGSYYTPDSLVQCLLDSALDPVVDEAVKGRVGAEAEKAILSLKVCDPAVGSGHFLVGAAHRLARHLARVRALTHGDSEPSPLLYQQALRDVIGRCLYGVDINPMAAELCRVGLWLEALEPGKPLSFLDHHIRVGNSLLGTTPELIAAGIPDDAFKPIEGDDKKACAGLKKRNKAERTGWGPLFARQDAETQARLQQAALALEELPDDRPEDIRSKELAFRRHEVTKEYLQKKKLADAWCAAFVIHKHFPPHSNDPRFPSTEPSGITQGHLNGMANGRPLPGELEPEVGRLSGQYQFFHWHLSFPEVFARGGFDCVLGNPPWEHTELKEKEWFAECRPEVANARTGAERKRMIEALKQEDPPLYALFANSLREHEGEGHFLGNSGRYPLCGRGRINLYAVFAEGMGDMLNEMRRLGCVLPTGIATDDTTKFFFQNLMESRSLVSLFSFDNKEALFPAVKSSTRFCLITIVRKGGMGTLSPKFVFYAGSVEHLEEAHRGFSLSLADIALLNPNSRTCPVFRSKRDAEITKALYRRVPVFIRETQGRLPDVNPWGITFKQGLFNMASDSGLFRTAKQVGEQGWSHLGNIYYNGDKRYVPLYEAKMTGHFDHRSATYQGDSIRELTFIERNDPSFFSIPRYWVPEIEVESRLHGRWNKGWLLGWQDVTDVNTMARTVNFAVMPRVGVGHTAPLMFSETQADLLRIVTANFASFIFDYVARQKIGGVHLTYQYLKQLPLLTPTAFAALCPWSCSRLKFCDWIIPRVLELTYTAWDLEAFGQDCHWSGPPFRWDEERRFLLRCELDAAFFHLYLTAETDGEWRRAENETEEDLARLKTSFPTPRDAVAYIMETFPIVKRKDIAQYGSYRTKDTILEIYDAMAGAVRTRQPYKTRLDPPPADPSCCHLPRDNDMRTTI